MLLVDMVYFITHYCCSYLEIFISISKYGMYEIHLLILIVSNKKCIYYYTRKLVSGYFKKSLFFFIDYKPQSSSYLSSWEAEAKSCQKLEANLGFLTCFKTDV